MQKNLKDINTVSYNYEALHKKAGLAQIWTIFKNDLLSNTLSLLLAFIIFGLFIFFVLGIVFDSIFGADLAMSSVLFYVLFIAVFLVFAFFYSYSFIHKLVSKFKMSQFAKANNIGFVSTQDLSAYSGLIFNEGRNKIINYAYLFNDKYNSEIGSYSYTSGYGKNSRTFTYSYIVFDLPRNVPHMLLDSKANNIMGLLSNLPVGFASNQKISLEGNFNDYFTLYAPRDYEKDALYIFTPDVMQAVIQNAKLYDIEIISNKLYVYSQSKFNLEDNDEIERLLKIINILVRQFYDQTNYYADESIGNRAANIVNTKGRRLKRYI